KRLVLGKEVRLRNAYIVRADDVVKDDEGNITEIHCTYDDETLGKNPSDGRKAKGVIHWVSAADAVDAEIRVYDRLFKIEDPTSVETLEEALNEHSLVVIKKAKVEPGLVTAKAESAYQFEREGYFCADSKDSTADKLVFNRTVSLRG
ncbi:MAG: glutamine--tRNA ligase, partial [Moritella sp.]|nr:glutamine--tRNA ligase [Moritella sp.]